MPWKPGFIKPAILANLLFKPQISVCLLFAILSTQLHACSLTKLDLRLATLLIFTASLESRPDGFLPFGTQFGDVLGPTALDGSSPPISFSARFYGSQEDTIYVSHDYT